MGEFILRSTGERVTELQVLRYIKAWLSLFLTKMHCHLFDAVSLHMKVSKGSGLHSSKDSHSTFSFSDFQAETSTPLQETSTTYHSSHSAGESPTYLGWADASSSLVVFFWESQNQSETGSGVVTSTTEDRSSPPSLLILWLLG